MPARSQCPRPNGASRAGSIFRKIQLGFAVKARFTPGLLRHLLGGTGSGYVTIGWISGHAPREALSLGRPVVISRDDCAGRLKGDGLRAPVRFPPPPPSDEDRNALRSFFFPGKCQDGHGFAHIPQGRHLPGYPYFPPCSPPNSLSSLFRTVTVEPDYYKKLTGGRHYRACLFRSPRPVAAILAFCVQLSYSIFVAVHVL
jgi:hypothetical protein